MGVQVRLAATGRPLSILYLLSTASVEKRTRVNSSGMCESHTPCGLHAQPPGSVAGGASLYWLNREKSMRHSSPSRGGSARPSGIARGSSERHGKRLYMVQTTSPLVLLFIRHDTW